MFWKRTLIRTQRTKRTDTFNGHLHLSILHILSKKENKRTTQRTTTKKNEKDDHTQKILKATVKPSPSEPERDPYELTIMIRKGKDRTDAPATGLGTYKLMSDWAQVSRVMNHFNLLDKISRV